ncbi:MAG: hypothetical protein PVI07_12545 [Anaerolineae bacterium]
MNKKERHQRDLSGLCDGFLETGDAGELLAYVASNSNLPGRRGNLELAQAFGDVVEDEAAGEAQRLWDLCRQMTDVSADEAPVNAPAELIPFCGALGIGAIGAVSPAFFEPALSTLRAVANDPRWRMREAVVFGLQRLLATRCQDTLNALERWVVAGAWLEMRAAAAAVAEPALLKDGHTAIAALELHKRIVDHVLQAEERRCETFRVLRKGLGYTLSVVVRALPEEGFAFMAELVDSGDPDALWVVKQNLKKRRLARNFPEEVASLTGRLSH